MLQNVQSIKLKEREEGRDKETKYKQFSDSNYLIYQQFQTRANFYFKILR